MQSYLNDRFPKAVFRYRISVLTSAVIATGIYFLTIKFSHLLVDAFQDRIVQLANLVGRKAAKILLLVAVLLGALPIPVLVHMVFVRFASRNAVLHCPHCGAFIAMKDSIRAIRKNGTCPTCEEHLIPDDEIGAEPFEQKRLPFID